MELNPSSHIFPSNGSPNPPEKIPLSIRGCLREGGTAGPEAKWCVQGDSPIGGRRKLLCFKRKIMLCVCSLIQRTCMYASTLYLAMRLHRSRTGGYEHCPNYPEASRSLHKGTVGYCVMIVIQIFYLTQLYIFHFSKTDIRVLPSQIRAECLAVHFF